MPISLPTLRTRRGRASGPRRATAIALLGAVAAAVAVAALLLRFPRPAIDPAAWRPPSAPPLAGVLAPNRALAGLDRLADGALAGPEDIEPDGAGGVFCGLADGTVRRVVPAGAGARIEPFAVTGGRPLGLDLDRAGILWVADARRGLLAIDGGGAVTVRARAAGGAAIAYADDVDTAPGGAVYLSDASLRHGPEELLLDTLEARPWGRLIEHRPATGETRVLLDDLYFANGVAVSEDGTFVLVAETFRYRLRRYWLAGPRAGRSEVFADNLPGFPDGVTADGRGGFWLALYALRDARLDRWLHPRPWLKRWVARLPPRLRPAAAPYGLVVRLDGTGRITRSLHDPGGERFGHVTSVEERDGVLWLGSVEDRALGRLELEPVSAAAGI